MTIKIKRVCSGPNNKCQVRPNKQHQAIMRDQQLHPSLSNLPISWLSRFCMRTRLASQIILRSTLIKKETFKILSRELRSGSWEIVWSVMSWASKYQSTSKTRNLTLQSLSKIQELWVTQKSLSYLDLMLKKSLTKSKSLAIIKSRSSSSPPKST